MTTTIEELRRKRDHAVQRFLDAGLRGTLYVAVSADDLLDADLYWASSPLAFVANQTVLVLDDTVATVDGGVLIVCLRELKALGFSFAVPDDMTPYQSLPVVTQRPIAIGAGDSAKASQSLFSTQPS